MMNYKSKYFSDQISLSESIQSLHPNAAFSIKDEDINQIEWQSTDIQMPSIQSILEEQSRLQSLRDAEIYKKQRALEYPSIEQQLDTLYHGGIDLWKASIDEIKNKYPKP